MNRPSRHQRWTRALFSSTAPIYHWLTWQETWIRHCAGLADYFPPAPASKPLAVLDLGIGPGVSAVGLLRRVPDLDVVGLDFSARMLRRAAEILRRESRRCPIAQGDATALPFADACFDVVTHHSFLYLLADREGALAEVARVLRPGGAYVMLEPRHGGRLATAARLRGPLRFRASMAAWRVISQGYGRFRQDELPRLLAPHGLDVDVQAETLGGLGWIVRATRR